ncbi:hypothetical protein [Embleya sp. AB8]|uniref:hypothetical protein n=1 Tax=Embleya sp. AB8 TaxID=3156304 RepID=UPI003C77BA93
MTTRFGRAALRGAVGVVLVSGLALSTAGCGSDGGGSTKSKVASGGGAGKKSGEPQAGAGAGGAGKDEDAARYEQMVKFAGCMRENGIDMPDPEPAAGGAVRMRAMPADGDSSKTENAMKACEKYQPKSEFDPNDPKFKEWQAKRTACLRDHGVDIGDSGTAAMTVDASDEKVMKAIETCDKQVPPPAKKK